VDEVVRAHLEGLDNDYDDKKGYEVLEWNLLVLK
jgi:hypothetical protein